MSESSINESIDRDNVDDAPVFCDDSSLNVLSDSGRTKSTTDNLCSRPTIPSLEVVDFRPVFYGLNELHDNIKSIQAKSKELIQPLIDLQNRTTQMILQFREPIQRILSTIQSYSDIFKSYAKNLYQESKIIEVLKNNQFTVWYIVEFDDSRMDTLDSNYVNEFMLAFFLANENQRLNKLIIDCREFTKNSTLNSLFEQASNSLLNDDYHLAIIGLTAILDSLLTSFSEDDTPKIKRRLDLIDKKLLEKEDSSFNSDEINEFRLYYTVFYTIESFGATAPFSEPEPVLLNRHWIMHGRTSREYTLIDCIKVLSMIYGMTVVGEYLK